MSVAKTEALESPYVLDRETLQNPYPTYDRLLSHLPVHWNPTFQAWTFTKMHDVLAILRDPKISSIRAATYFRAYSPEQMVELETLRRVIQSWVVFSDPPHHTKIRGLLNKAFLPKVMAQLRPLMIKNAEELLGDAIQKETFDFVSEFAYLLPVYVICDLLGFSRDDHHKCKMWLASFNEFFGLMGNADFASARRAAADYAKFEQFVIEKLKDRRERAGEDLLTDFVTARDEDGNVYDDFDIAANILLIFGAGHETTASLISNTMYQLLRHPEQFEKLKKDPSLLPGAIEEGLRFEAPVQWLSRIVGESLELADLSLKKGDRIMLCLASANRDPEHYINPNRFDITRQNNKNVSFGSGIHFCPGATLSRIEAEVAFSVLLEKIPNLRLVDETVTWVGGLLIRCPAKLMVTVK